MGIHSIIVDDFFDDPNHVRNYAISRDYKGVKNPEDGVVYPDVTIDILPSTMLEMVEKIQKLMWNAIEPKRVFVRLSTLGCVAPHQAHTDALMGEYTALIYLSKKADITKGAGTSIVEHANGELVSQPEDEEGVGIWRRDTNRPEMWNVVGFCPMKFNRLFIVKSDLFHRAEPITGFGETPEDGRLVLTLFFNLFKAASGDAGERGAQP